jgi:hypothetical protein
MAILSIGNLSLEIAYRWFDAGWVKYDIWCRWRGVPVFNPAILGNMAPQSADRAGVIEAMDYEICGLLPMLQKALEAKQSDVWYPLHPDVAVAVYMNGLSPMLPEELEASRLGAKARRRPENISPVENDPGYSRNHCIELLVFVDAFNFRHAEAYCGDGVCFLLGPTRDQLQKFYEDLRSEYAEFRTRSGIDAFFQRHE